MRGGHLLVLPKEAAAEFLFLTGISHDDVDRAASAPDSPWPPEPTRIKDKDGRVSLLVPARRPARSRPDVVRDLGRLLAVARDLPSELAESDAGPLPRHEADAALISRRAKPWIDQLLRLLDVPVSRGSGHEFLVWWAGWTPARLGSVCDRLRDLRATVADLEGWHVPPKKRPRGQPPGWLGPVVVSLAAALKPRCGRRTAFAIALLLAAEESADDELLVQHRDGRCVDFDRLLWRVKTHITGAAEAGALRVPPRVAGRASRK